MANTGKEGIMRKKGDTPNKDTPTLTRPLPHVSTATPKQREVLALVEKEMNVCQMSRKLGNIDERAIRDRLKFCEKKGFVIHENGCFKLTDTGKLAVKAFGVGVGVFLQKSQHSNEITCKILKLAVQFNAGQQFFNTMGSKSAFHSVTTKTWFLYYPDCTVRLSYGTMEASFFVQEQSGYIYEEIGLKVWDQFVKHWGIIAHNGFELGFSAFSRLNPHFADPNGLFAKLASYSDGKGFRIETEFGAFWVDYSLGSIPHEETDQPKIAARTEDLARSGISSKGNFHDLDKVAAIVPQLFEVAVLQSQNIASITQALMKQPSSPQAPPLQEKKEKEERDYFG